MALRKRALLQWQVSPEVIDQSLELMGRAFTPREIASLALFGQKVGSENVRMEMVPVVEVRRGTLRVDQDKLERKLKDMRLDDRRAERFATR